MTTTTDEPSTTPATTTGSPVPLVIDYVLVVVFAVIGRASHAADLTPLGVLVTAWPFLIGCFVGHVFTRAWRHPARLWPTGVVIWLLTVPAGMMLRIAAGDTAAVPFIVVATITLAVFLLGWRLVALVVRRVRS
ncbi:DUF3054 domain-containing protein [Propionibacteriaceae bacterium Y2011]|uniref:DUF3054 domain-containing protein n=1 Tax=Microlunatus sp. Y2014 TaxID=3418488 RepID=UPI003B48458F